MSNIPKMGHLPTPENCETICVNHLQPLIVSIMWLLDHLANHGGFNIIQQFSWMHRDAPHFSLKNPLTFDVVPEINRGNPADLGQSMSIPITGKNQVLLYPVSFGPICWMATERSSDGEIPRFFPHVPGQATWRLCLCPCPERWTHPFWKRNNKGALKSLWNSLLFRSGMCFFCFYFGARNLWKTPQGPCFWTVYAAIRSWSYKCRSLWPRFGLFRVGFGLGWLMVSLGLVWSLFRFGLGCFFSSWFRVGWESFWGWFRAFEAAI